MSHLDTALDAALGGDVVLFFTAVEILHPSATVRLLLDASDEVTFSSHTYTGQDGTYGVLLAADAVSDGVDAEVPRLNITLAVPDVSAAVTLCAPGGQGAVVNVWAGAVNALTGAVIGTPDLWFSGQIDVATYSVPNGGALVQFEVEGFQAAFFEEDEGVLLTNSTHQDIWPGELGLEYVTEVQRQLPWGSDQPRPSVITDVIRTGAGGGTSAFTGDGPGFSAL